MTQENKDLLLQDLCGRLPYGVKIYFGGIPKLLTSITIKTGYIEILVEGEYGKAAYCDFISTYNNTEYLQEEITEKCKPYLRPLSSMTEEEMKSLPFPWVNKFGTISSYREEEGFLEIIHNECSCIIDWLNKNMFDYRGLIPKGIALSTEVFNPYKD